MYSLWVDRGGYVMVKIGRHINGITLNGYEWLLKPNSKDIRYFRNMKTAK